MSGNIIGMLVVIIAYMVMMLYIGFRCQEDNKTVGDFYLGGRKLGPFVSAMSAEASDMSSWLLMGLPGVAYLTGSAEAVWTAIGLAIGTYLNWLIVAKRLRIYSEKLNAITIPGFFEKRFGDKSRSLRSISAVIILIFFVPYTASGFSACGKLFSTIFGMPYVPAMIVSAVIVVGYTTFGGFLAASFTDLIQSIIMTIALVIVVLFGIRFAGGWDCVVENANSMAGYISLTSIYNPETNAPDPYSALTIASLLAWGLGYFGMPHILLRFMGTKDVEKIKLSRRIASIWVVIAMGVAILIGVIGNAITAAGGIEYLSTSSEAETLIIKVAMMISNLGPVAVIFGGLILAGILACTMSTADSQLLAAASSFSEDIVAQLTGKEMSNKTTMLLARVTVIVISIIAVILAINPDSSVFRIVSFAWAGFGATFGPAMLLALFWKRANRNGIFAGLVAGAVMVFAWKFGISNLGGVFAIYELLPAFIVNIVIAIVVSLATKAPEKEIIEQFESV